VITSECKHAIAANGGFCSLLNVSLLGRAPIHWICWLLEGAVDFGVGFLLAYGLVSKYVLERNATAQAKGALLRSKLAGIQAPLGGFAMVMGLLYIVL
jgi:hypothetical protein